MRLGIFGGSFSPVHNGHVEIASEFLKEFSLDKLLIIPTGSPPYRDIAPYVSNKARFEMCQMAFSGIRSTEVSDIELCRKGKSYTVHTLKELSSPSTELFMLVGSDKIPNMKNWYGSTEIFTLCTVVYAERAGYPQNVEKDISELVSRFNAKIVRLNVKTDDISSEMIRSAISDGKDIKQWVPHKVEKYIRDNGLYQNNAK